MKFLIYDPMTTETRLPRLFRYDRVSAEPDAEWDRSSRTWRSLGSPNMVEAELDRGSYGMRVPDISEIIAITGADKARSP